MTVSMPPSSKEELVVFVRDFIDTPNCRRSLHEFQRLAGWINWSFNVFPLMKLCLSNIYEKMKGKQKQNTLIYLNEPVKSDLRWFLHHVESSSGIYLFEGLDWNPSEDADFTIFCDACLDGMGFYIPELRLGFYCPVPEKLRNKLIFFYEALCVISAIHWYGSIMRADPSLTQQLRLTTLTDSQNMVDIFNSLSASPDFNLLLQSAVDDFIHFDIDARILHVKGLDNGVTDTISRNNFTRAYDLVPGLLIRSFEPPPQWLGGGKK